VRFGDQPGDSRALLDNRAAPSAGPLIRLKLPFEQVLADDREPVANFPLIAAAQAFDFLCNVIPVDLIGGSPAQRIRLALRPARKVLFVEIAHRCPGAHGSAPPRISRSITGSPQAGCGSRPAAELGKRARAGGRLRTWEDR
jgi:hypothetical protein